MIEICMNCGYKAQEDECLVEREEGIELCPLCDALSFNEEIPLRIGE